ncbi:hypothetical protein PP714_09920 [Lacticaseibacillus paracasei]|nr:hypothetical protein [Lacticaseibacillus paracasei]
MSQQSNTRQEMLDNAVSFLTDPSVADTPMAKKIQFLESKGMSNAEINQALTIAATQQQTHKAPPPAPPIPAGAGVPSTGGGLGVAPFPYYAPPPPPAPRSYDWKDYVIMGTTSAGIMYGAYQIVSRYLLPKVIPPSQSKLDEDKESLEREFQRVEAVLEQLEKDQSEFISRQDEKTKLIDEALMEVDAIVKATNEKNLRNEETLKYLKLEVDSIKTTLLKNLEAQKSTISSELKELEEKTDNLISFIDSIDSKKETEGYRQSGTEIPRPSPSPPANLLTNNRSTSSVSVPTEPKYELDIPPPSSVPSAKDILNENYKSTSSTSLPPPAEVTTTEPSSNIPAWQLASAQKSKIGNSDASIPAWQLAAQDN